MTILEALKQGQPVSHPKWYDGRAMHISDHSPVLITLKHLVSDQWVSHAEPKKPVEPAVDNSVETVEEEVFEEQDATLK